MASFLRHVGKQGDRKVAIVFREVPGEPHMCLVVFTELLNQNIHDPLVKCIESDIGQSSEHLAEALNRSYTQDGRIILQVLHQEGQLKKVRTESVVVTPQPNVQIKLIELNKILDEMKMGEEAIKKMAEMDKSLGMTGNADAVKKLRGEQKKAAQVPPVQAVSGDALGDVQLAANFRAQAEKMDREAKGLLAEAARLLQEAAALEPKAAPAPVKAKKSSKKALA